MMDATLEPVEALKQRIAELESFLLNYDHAMKIERHDFKSEISALQTKLELARKFIGSFTKHHDEVWCSTFLDDAPEDECDCAKGAATKLLAQLAAPDTDYCPSCGEYLHDEMGHMCPPHNAAPDTQLCKCGRPSSECPGCLVCDSDDAALEERDRAEDNELKPCPFCGGKARFLEVEEEQNKGSIVVECTGCNCCTACVFPAKADAKPHAQFLWNRRERGLDAILAHRIAPHTDHCPSCGEYLHDEMGHMCPDTGVQQDPYVRLRAALVENDHLKRQLAEARRKAFEEAAEIAEKMTPLSGMGVQTGRHIAKALREAGKRGLKG